MIVEGFALDSDTARVVLARVLANYAATIRWGCVLAAPLWSRGMAWDGSFGVCGGSLAQCSVRCGA